MTKEQAIEAGKNAAMQKSTAGWGLAGFFFTIPALLIVYLRSPSVNLAELVRYDDQESERYFEMQYVETLKSRQVSATWIGAVIGLILVFVFMCGTAGMVLA